jgi:aminopeptidase N
MYRRAPLLLHQLEERIGRDRFERFLTLYMVEGARTTPDLLA